ncbi:Fc.00g105630.m01.CDS01 [Cosmosporella sp. VM-42]
MDSTRRYVGAIGSRTRALRSAVPLVSRCCGTIVSRCANRRFVFAIAGVAVVGAKLVHVYAHLPALSTSDILHWGLSFFAQDAILLLIVHLLLENRPARGLLRFLSTAAASITVVTVLALASFSISFFAIAGSELHWRNIGFIGDASSRKMLAAGIIPCFLTFVSILVVSWLVQDICYGFMSLTMVILKWPFIFFWSRLPSRRRLLSNVRYAHIPQQELESAIEQQPLRPEKDEDDSHSSPNAPLPATRTTIIAYVLISIVLLALIFETLFRPGDASLTFMSWTLVLLPAVDFAHSSPTLGSLLPVHGTSINYSWDNRTALEAPIPLSWLPKDNPLPGFEDWYEKGKTHYRASSDPMRISNLDNDLIPGLKGKLGDINIKHVILVKLESTRKDVFPLKKDGYIWNALINSWADKAFPTDVEEYLSTLTSAANIITGDYKDGFEHKDKKPRGGLSFNNAHTSSSYTLKSLTATLCGVSPLVADWNMEIFNHFYQPCLPQILDAFGTLDRSKDNSTDEYKSFDWVSSYMQSVTGGYDKQDIQMPMLGFDPEHYVTIEYLKALKETPPKFGNIDNTIHHDGIKEFALEDYVRDAFQTAKKDNKRVFLTHLTGSSHHPFRIPVNETFTEAAGDKKYHDLSKYLNTIGFVDRWLQRLLDVLEEEGVADETLIVFVGDHGLSIAEKHAVTPYYAPHVANIHVPLVISHPKLPVIDIDDAVVSLQILPTIFDLLVETGSLSESDTKAAREWMQNLEGQSLLRTQNKESKKTGQPNWQYTVMNPGRALLSVRDAREPNWRMVVPIVDDLEWRFTDLAQDPYEEHPVSSFGFRSFLEAIERDYGIAASEWAENAAFMSRWWVEENRMRWRYDPFNATANGYSPFKKHS